MLQNAYSLAKIGADTAENEQNFAKQLATTLGSRRPLRREAGARRDGREGDPHRGAGPGKPITEID